MKPYLIAAGLVTALITSYAFRSGEHHSLARTATQHVPRNPTTRSDRTRAPQPLQSSLTGAASEPVAPETVLLVVRNTYVGHVPNDPTQAAFTIAGAPHICRAWRINPTPGSTHFIEHMVIAKATAHRIVAAVQALHQVASASLAETSQLNHAPPTDKASPAPTPMLCPTTY